MPVRFGAQNGRRLRRPFCFGLLAWLLIGQAQAEGLGVAPLVVTVPPDARAATILVRAGDRARVIHVEVAKSRMDPYGQEYLEDTDEVFPYPPIFRLAAHATRRVRLTLSPEALAARRTRELAWRVTVGEAPIGAPTGGIQVQMAYRLWLFAPPPKPHVRARLQARRTGGQLWLVLANEGNVHLRPLAGARIVLLAGKRALATIHDDPPHSRWLRTPRILPGDVRWLEWPWPAAAKGATHVRLELPLEGGRTLRLQAPIAR